MSAIGSLTIHELLLPACFRHARDFAVQSESPEAEAADTKLAQEAAGTSATPAPVPVTALELGLLQIFCDFCGCCHRIYP
jgi:hypothetical protein